MSDYKDEINGALGYLNGVADALCVYSVDLSESVCSVLEELKGNINKAYADALVAEPLESPEQPTEEPQEVDLEIESADDPVYGEGANEPAFSEQPISPVIDATEDFSDEAVRAAGGEPMQEAAINGPFATSEQLFKALKPDASEAEAQKFADGVNRAAGGPDFGPTES